MFRARPTRPRRSRYRVSYRLTRSVPAALVAVLLLLTITVVTLGSLALTFALPSIVLAVDHGGIPAGFEIGAIYRRARSSPINTLIAGLMLVAAGLIGQLGAFACVVGVVFTNVYALAMQAWIIRSFEVGSADSAQPGATGLGGS